MTVDILVLQSTFNLHTIRCFLYLICYLGVAVDDTPQGGNALDADEQFLDYSHILTDASAGGTAYRRVDGQARGHAPRRSTS